MRKRKRAKKKDVSMIGKIIDLPLADFEEELKRQRVNIGTINNLILNLEGAYYELRTRKDSVLKMSFEDKIDKAQAQDTLNGLYAEMIKVEQKITYLKQRSKELVNVDNTQIDKSETP